MNEGPAIEVPGPGGMEAGSAPGAAASTRWSSPL